MAFSFIGQVEVLNAPLFNYPSKEAKIIQYLRKGERIYLKNLPITNGMKNEFSQTIDKNGAKAYILTAYLKIISNDNNEIQFNKSQLKDDPSDYRKNVKTPPYYPFWSPGKIFYSLSFSTSREESSPFDYQKTIVSQEKNNSYTLSFSSYKKMNFDPYNIHFHGFNLSFSSGKNKSFLQNDVRVDENYNNFFVGYSYLYKQFEGENFNLILKTSAGIGYHSIALTSNISGMDKNISYIAWKPSINMSWQISKTNIQNHFNILLGPKASIYFPANYKAKLSTVAATLLNKKQKSQEEILLGFELSIMFKN